MSPRLLVLLVLCLAAAGLRGAERTFSGSLTPEQRARLGLAGLKPAQLAELDAAVAAFARGETTVAVEQAVQQAERKAEEKVQQERQRAAETALAEYRRKEEPGIIARALEGFRRDQEQRMQEKFSARIAGPFRGWTGNTVFQLDNGQVWRQSNSDEYVIPVVDSPPVEIFRASSGHYRLRLADGAWVTVRRLQ